MKVGMLVTGFAALLLSLHVAVAWIEAEMRRELNKRGINL